ncbi:MAG TPA: SPFH domain-containing protein [Pirellulaceae bacterium]|nr:SPFH domain-containing protein [Pirellulaceae bacterium]HMO91241.1 SPFH domain-containing protein [Pirellulaceae bacterium]HMP68575.1 SPFH domain-containing protein [Pirellulaceae bacterium]
MLEVNLISSLVLAQFEFLMPAFVGTASLIVIIGLIALLIRCWQKVSQGTAIVRNGMGGTAVSFSGMFVIPILHKAEWMDISVKRIEIDRHGSDGLICKDNIRADIKVAFFVRVNKTADDVKQVAQFLGCKRASDQSALVALFEPKFSEALKSVGKQFDFIELYSSREKFREEIKKVIGTDLNGYLLDDAAIDFLEQTPIESLNVNNVLDAEGIKKITDLTAREQVQANLIRNEKDKTIKKQDVEAREAILVLERQQAEAEEKQAREISEITSRQRAEAEIVAQEERRRQELARITADEEIAIADENRLRAIIVAEKNKQRTDAVETERVERDRGLEMTERERVVTLAQIDKEKAVEVENKNIQEVIRQRVMVEREVVQEKERIKDTEQFAAAERKKKVAITAAEEIAQQEFVTAVKAAEAEKESAELQAKTIVIKADAEKTAAEKETEAKKMLAEAVRAEQAAPGLAEADITLAKADALRKEGKAEAEVLELKFSADAKGITQKAEAMKLFDGVGREHEEFKLRLNKDKEIELQAIATQEQIAKAQASMVGDALKAAKIDIVGGDTKFFESIVGSVTAGKQVDRLVEGSSVLSDIKETFFSGDSEHFKSELARYIDMFGITSNDVKNLSVAALIGQMMGLTEDQSMIGQLENLIRAATRSGMYKAKVSALDLSGKNSST